VTVRVVVNRGAIDHLLSDPDGPIGVKVRSFSIRVRNRAKTLCPVATGLLRDSIHEQRGEVVKRRVISYTVGSNVRYARFVHDGTRYMQGRPFLTTALHMERGL
jgi:HK97 gp10 family phage protein